VYYRATTRYRRDLEPEWVGGDVHKALSGMYLYRLETPQGSFVRTMLLAK